jgi:excisionase family DNA binding protein
MPVTFTDDEIHEAERLGLGPFKRHGIREAALLLGVDYTTARRLISTGELEATRVGRRVFILGGHVVRWILTQAARQHDVQKREGPSTAMNHEAGGDLTGTMRTIESLSSEGSAN